MNIARRPSGGRRSHASSPALARSSISLRDTVRYFTANSSISEASISASGAQWWLRLLYFESLTGLLKAAREPLRGTRLLHSLFHTPNFSPAGLTHTGR